MKHMHQILRHFRRVLAPCLGLCLMLWGQAASAQLCTTTALPPVFAAYQASGTGNNGTGSVSVSCVVLVGAQSVFYTVKLGLSGQAQGTQRRMSSGAAYLSYNLFCDSGYSQIWADGNSGTCVATGGQAGLLGTLLTVYPVYGRIPGGQYVAPGSYSDIVSIEVLY